MEWEDNRLSNDTMMMTESQAPGKKILTNLPKTIYKLTGIWYNIRCTSTLYAEEVMRLDKYLSLCGKASRTETAKAVKGGEVLVNGTPAKRADVQIDENADAVVFRGEPVIYRQYTWVMLHKPDGVVSATEDRLKGERTVLDLLPEELTRLRPPLFPCGRLDKHTTGLILLCNDGALSHKLLSPARHVDKAYAFTVKFPLSVQDISALETGVDIGGYVTAPCTMDVQAGGREGRIIIHEGKYHQIKLMMEAVHNQITSLSRLTFGPLSLDPTLAPGEWRLLTDEEIGALSGAVR